MAAFMRVVEVRSHFDNRFLIVFLPSSILQVAVLEMGTSGWRPSSPHHFESIDIPPRFVRCSSSIRYYAYMVRALFMNPAENVFINSHGGGRHDRRPDGTWKNNNVLVAHSQAAVETSTRGGGNAGGVPRLLGRTMVQRSHSATGGSYGSTSTTVVPASVTLRPSAPTTSL